MREATDDSTRSSREAPPPTARNSLLWLCFAATQVTVLVRELPSLPVE